MSYRLTQTDPVWTFDVQAAERKFAAVMKNHNITTEANKATLIGNITTLAQCIEVCQGFLSCFTTEQ